MFWRKVMRDRIMEVELMGFDNRLDGDKNV